MPIHDFRCGACGQAFELLVRGNLEPTGPHRAGSALERQVSLTAPQGTSKTIVARAPEGQGRGALQPLPKAERRSSCV